MIPIPPSDDFYTHAAAGPLRHLADGHQPCGPIAVGDVLYERACGSAFSGLADDELGTNWLIHTTSGDIYLPRLCALVHSVRRDLFRPPFTAFAEVAFPRLLPTHVAERFGLVARWPYILLSAQGFSEEADQRVFRHKDDDHLLDPVQCATLYACFAGNRLRLKEVPICVRETLGGWSYRNERIERINPLSHASQFLRDEYIYIGVPEHVTAIRLTLVDALCAYLAEQDLAFRLTVGSGCFEFEPGELDRILARLGSTAQLPMIDVEVYVPHDDSWLEICGASLLGSALLDRFDICGEDSQLGSGCVGIGISRLCYGILAQRGITD